MGYLQVWLANIIHLKILKPNVKNLEENIDLIIKDLKIKKIKLLFKIL